MAASRSRRRWLKRGLAALLLGVALWLFASYSVADQLTRRAAPMRPEPVPAVAWGTLQPLRLATADGHDLGAWFVRGLPDRPVVLLLHGNGANRTDCLPQAEMLAREGFPVLLVTLRAHGDSTGDRNDFGRGARADVVAAVEWAEANRPGPPVVVWGRSLGAAAALFAAGDLGGRVGGYVLECPYRDLRTAVRNRTRLYLAPVVEWVAYAGLTVTAPLVVADVDRISPCEAAGNVPRETPVLVLAGGLDRQATPDDARAIQDRLGPRTDLVVMDRGGHLDLERPDPARYHATVLGFLSKCGNPPQ